MGTTLLEKLRNAGNGQTFFAPHDSAFANVDEQLRSQLLAMTNTLANAIFLYHTGISML